MSAGAWRYERALALATPVMWLIIAEACHERRTLPLAGDEDLDPGGSVSGQHLSDHSFELGELFL